MTKPPGLSVWLATRYWEAESALYTLAPMVSGDKYWFVVSWSKVLVPIMIADPPDAKETGVPSNGIAVPPGISVWLAIRY